MISPLLANTYIHRLLKAWKKFGLEKRLGARIVNYADDLVILCRKGKAEEALRQAYPHVDLFLRPSDYMSLVHHLCDNDLLPAASAGVLETPPVSMHVPISYGCDHHCTYCIVRLRRGRERSRPVGEIVDEVRGLSAGGGPGPLESLGVPVQAVAALDLHGGRPVGQHLLQTSHGQFYELCLGSLAQVRHQGVPHPAPSFPHLHLELEHQGHAAVERFPGLLTQLEIHLCADPQHPVHQQAAGFRDAEHPAAGAGLIFQTLPVAFAQMPGGWLFSVLFFVMLSFAGITSMVGLVESVNAWVEERFGIAHVTLQPEVRLVSDSVAEINHL